MADAASWPTVFKGPLVIASDHAGFALKRQLAAAAAAAGLTVEDIGPATEESVDYPDYAAALAERLSGAPETAGVLVCGTGIGMSIAANRHPHIRAGMVHDVTGAKLTRGHNDANVMCVGARTTGDLVAIECLQAFLATPFEGGRHARRVAKMSPTG